MSVGTICFQSPPPGDSHQQVARRSCLNEFVSLLTLCATCTCCLTDLLGVYVSVMRASVHHDVIVAGLWAGSFPVTCCKPALRITVSDRHIICKPVQNFLKIPFRPYNRFFLLYNLPLKCMKQTCLVARCVLGEGGSGGFSFTYSLNTRVCISLCKSCCLADADYLITGTQQLKCMYLSSQSTHYLQHQAAGALLFHHS